MAGVLVFGCLCYGASKTEAGKAVQQTMKVTVSDIVFPRDETLYRRVLSTVYPDPKLWWEFAPLYYNEVIRRLCEDARKILGSFDPVTKEWQIELFDNWYNNLFYRFISIHQERQEAIFFPELKKRDIDIPVTLLDSYVIMLDVMEKIKHEITVLQSTDTNTTDEAKSAAANNIREMFFALIDRIYVQLDERERVIVPQIGQKCTENDEKFMAGLVILSEKNRKSAKKDRKHKKKAMTYTSELKVDGQFILACMYDACTEWMTPEQLVSFLQLLPTQARMSVKNVWHPLYVQKEKTWAGLLMLETAPKVDLPWWNRFMIL